ncbi:ScbA/BarX family gamma-butyrolactone biosynthesis protein [Streptomyces sp. NRRL S-87]|uniref:ScbA/BarX family gamma-butyrolactone biosynthesis protein n=1 Tax=Streptomyces sp. NRRL S-87 TaxID=1463920 RepID=UPI0007C4B425|nr:ScbA/BarX family gamma-butyrolactone biosynthesis protein [Streptomyces sp. NRRL S-87]
MTASTFGVVRTTDLRHLNLTTTVPKEFVHRASVAEVMLTDWRREDDTHIALTAQWPRSHSFFTPVEDSRHDPLMVAETIRQAGTLVAHVEFGVPLDRQFLVHDIRVAVHPEHLAVGHSPASVDIALTCTTVKRHRGALASLRVETVIRRDGHVVATGGGSFSCLTRPVYERIRASRPLSDAAGQPALIAPAAPQSVGRMSPKDVVLSPVGERDTWQLRVDTRHPVLFDHPVDHVPGMLLMEAARQAAAGALGRSSLMPLSISGQFHRYVELNSPCQVTACRLPQQTRGADPKVLVTCHQEGRLSFTGNVTARAYRD